MFCTALHLYQRFNRT